MACCGSPRLLSSLAIIWLSNESRRNALMHVRTFFCNASLQGSRLKLLRKFAHGSPLRWVRCPGVASDLPVFFAKCICKSWWLSKNGATRATCDLGWLCKVSLTLLCRPRCLSSSKWPQMSRAWSTSLTLQSVAMLTVRCPSRCQIASIQHPVTHQHRTHLRRCPTLVYPFVNESYLWLCLPCLMPLRC